MSDQAQQPPPTGRAEVRFEATIHPGDAGEAAFGRVADLDLYRIPDPAGEVRVLIDLEGCARLVQQGFEVRLQRALPVRPLDPELIPDDDQVRAWLDERIRGATGRDEGS